MNEEQDQQQIREVIATWMRASKENDLDTVLTLMAEDVVFLRPGQPPMRGRDAFAAASRSVHGSIRLEDESEIQEIRIDGDHAYCWNNLSLTITPVGGGSSMRQAGPILSVFRREPDGRWVLFRDANLLVPVTAS
jgi:uncharacterized protein (TIGR02246 family)